MFAEDKLEMRITVFNQQYDMLYSNLDNTETKYLTIKITRMVSCDYKTLLHNESSDCQLKGTHIKIIDIIP